MKILIAPDKFKGSLTAKEVCEAVKTGINRLYPEYRLVELPLADGGEGFSEAIIGEKSYEKLECLVKDPIGRNLNSHLYIISGKTAIVEMANASGLNLLSPQEKNPLKTSTFGTGQLINYAIKMKVDEIIVGIGGSATNDAGIGMAAALGYIFLDENRSELEPVGENLIKIKYIVEPKLKPWKNVKIKVACDVSNPLFGFDGAAYIFAKQKGANDSEIEALDNGLKHFAKICSHYFKTDMHTIPGAGAAGGLGYGLVTFLNAELKSGIDLILEANDFDEKLVGVDLVITGEGKMDIQTLSGKVVAGVAKKAKEKKIPVYGICGISELTDRQVNELGLKKLASLKSDNISTEYAIQNAKELIIERVKQIF